MIHNDDVIRRNNWDSRDAALDKIERERKRYAQIARKIGDANLIELAQEHAADLVNVRAAFKAIREPLEAAVDALANAAGAYDAALATDAAGTLDPKCALRNREAVVVAEARVRRLARTLPTLRASANGESERVSATGYRSDAKTALDETLAIVAAFFVNFEEYPNAALARAEEQGKQQTSARSAAWWPIAEALGREEFAARLAKEKEEHPVARPGTMEFDHRREERRFPSEKDLEAAFERRRSAFRQKREQARAQYEALGGQLEVMGGTR